MASFFQKHEAPGWVRSTKTDYRESTNFLGSFRKTSFHAGRFEIGFVPQNSNKA
jgi:hypothetical protein